MPVWAVKDSNAPAAAAFLFPWGTSGGHRRARKLRGVRTTHSRLSASGREGRPRQSAMATLHQPKNQYHRVRLASPRLAWELPHPAPTTGATDALGVLSVDSARLTQIPEWSSGSSALGGRSIQEELSDADGSRLSGEAVDRAVDAGVTNGGDLSADGGGGSCGDDRAGAERRRLRPSRDGVAERAVPLR